MNQISISLTLLTFMGILFAVKPTFADEKHEFVLTTDGKVWEIDTKTNRKMLPPYYKNDASLILRPTMANDATPHYFIPSQDRTTGGFVKVQGYPIADKSAVESAIGSANSALSDAIKKEILALKTSSESDTQKVKTNLEASLKLILTAVNQLDERIIAAPVMEQIKASVREDLKKEFEEMIRDQCGPR